MQGQRYHSVTSSQLSILNPLSPGRLRAILYQLPLGPGARVLDLGCGKGESLILLAEHCDIRGVGVDIGPGFLDDARGRAAGRIRPASALEWLPMPGQEFTSVEPFSLVLSLGTAWIHGGFAGSVSRLPSFLEPGGLLLIGDCYWRRPPPPEYLELAGLAADDWGTHADNVQEGLRNGLIPLYADTSSRAEWDHYEWMRVGAAERHAREHPDDPDNPFLLQRARQGRDSYLRYGRDYLGWASYLFLKP